MQQLKLTFQTENPILPRELDRLLVSFLKATVQNYSQEFFDILYDKKKSVIKPYTFSTYLPGAKFAGEHIILGQNSFTMLFSDADIGEFIRFINAFRGMKNKKYSMNRNSMQLTDVMLQKRREIQDSEIVIKMLSSLLVRRHFVEGNRDQYFTCNDSAFSQILKENIEISLDKLQQRFPTDGFSITPVKGKKIVVPVFGRLTDASIGVFKLTGAPKLLTFLYDFGLGARRSEGHGKFEVVS